MRLKLAVPGTELKICDGLTGRELLALPVPRIEYSGSLRTVRDPSVAFSPDGKRITVQAPDGTVRVWDVETGTEAHRLPAYRQRVRVAFGPNGRWLAFVVRDSETNRLKIFDLSDNPYAPKPAVSPSAADDAGEEPAAATPSPP